MAARMARRIAGTALWIGLSTVLLALLGGCGFQLRGAVPLPPVMERTYIQTADNSPLYFDLQNAIEAAGGTLADRREAASAILTIHGERFSRRAQGVDPQGRVNEYAHYLQVVFSLHDHEGRRVAEREQVSLRRDQRFNPDQVLAMDEEQAMLREEMRRQAVTQIMRRLLALSQDQPK